MILSVLTSSSRRCARQPTIRAIAKTGVYSSDDNALPANGGTVYMTYKLPYGGDFNTGKITEFVDAYNEAHPDAPMIFDYVAVSAVHLLIGLAG